MKKTITGAFIAVFLVLGLTLTPAVPAFAADPVLGISGTVTDKDTGKPADGAHIQILCDGVLVFSTTTDGGGNYTVPADSAAKCQVGGTLTITATKDDKSDTYTSNDTKDINIIDLRLKEHINIPEYGLLGGILASTGAIGIVALVRRRNANI